MEALQEILPNTRRRGLKLLVAGQRVQIIKDTAAGRGMLQFGTEVISAADGSIAALLGASPGASRAGFSVMLEVIKKCFRSTSKREPKIREMIPSYGMPLLKHPELIRENQTLTARTLGLSEKLPLKIAR